MKIYDLINSSGTNVLKCPRCNNSVSIKTSPVNKMKYICCVCRDDSNIVISINNNDEIYSFSIQDDDITLHVEKSDKLNDNSIIMNLTIKNNLDDPISIITNLDLDIEKITKEKLKTLIVFG